MFIADLTGEPNIKEVEVRSFTATHVISLTGTRLRRIIKGRIYAETRPDAIRHMNDFYTQQVRVVRDRLKVLEDRLAIVRGW
jgi:hypothetical protein